MKEQKKLDSPEIVCLCGSTRFIDTFNEWRQKLTLEGKIVLSVEIVTSQSKEVDPQYSNPEVKQMLDELHLRKIDLAGEVMILNVGGYIGESTRNELNYAIKEGKKITYLEDLCPECYGKTVMFGGNGMDTQYKICPRYKEAGHKTEAEITTEIQRVQRLIRPSGRWA